MRKFLLPILLVLTEITGAQTGCPYIDIGPDFNLPCTQSCTTLHANYFRDGATATYSVSQIPYAPAPFSGTPVLIGIDDQYSDIINLPFSFCFFGQSYNQFVIGSNGVISFDITNANGGNTYTPNAIPSPFPADLLNCIMCPWQDIDPTYQGDIYWQSIGTYPCRQFVISWVHVPYYGDPNSVSTGTCPGPLWATQQIVLYETTNVIDINIQNKEVCPGWVGGRAVEGIQNATGSVAYTVPGRNNTQWTTSNDSWRFAPSGPPTVTVAWALNGAPIGSGDSITVCPTTYGLYSAAATYQSCPGNTPVVVTDYLFLGTKNLTVNIDSVHNPSCGQNNGTVYASYSTTSAVLSYGWTPGPQGTTTLTGVGPGTYIFQTDITGCTRYDTATLVNTGSVSVVVNDSAFTSCTPPGNAGVLCANPVGGQSPYTYVWDNSQTSACVTGLVSGNYNVTVTDAGGCTATDGGAVSYTYLSPSLAPPQITDVGCNGGSDGAIILAPVNLQPPVNYIWSGGLPNSSTPTGLSQGSYSVTATDVNGCTASGSYSVNQPSAIVIGNPTITQATCAQGGSITVSALGGTGALAYNWSNSQSGTSINNLSAGPYTLTVTDQNLCTATATYNVTAPPNVITFGNPVITDVSCNGGNDGSITANASGGAGNISFVWSNSQTGASIANLIAGAYSVTASDVNNCTVSVSYIVNEPTALVFGNPVINATSCSGGGSITVSASGGTGNISFTWSNTQTGASIANVPAGSYTVTATDQNLCTISATYNVPAGPGAVVISNPVIVDVSCFGGNDGSISISSSGGGGVLTASWSNTQTGNTITGLTAGNYSVTVADNTGCTATATYSVAEPVRLVIDSANIQNIGCSGNATGSITVYVSGGTPAYIYSWVRQSNSQNFSGQTINNLSADVYNLSVTDNNGCTAATSYQLTQVTALTFSQSSTNVSCNGGSDGTATITVNTGTPPYSYNWNNTGANTNSTLTSISAGIVNVTIADANCSATATLNITEPTALVISLVNQTQVSCYGGNNGTVTINATGGINPISILWSDAQTGNTASNLAAGNISVTATDANSCTVSQTFTVTEPTPVVLSATGTDALCFDASNGMADAVVSGGTPPYTYLWNDGQPDSHATGLHAGNYSCVVTDSHFCTASAGTTINQPSDMQINTSVTSVKCIGDKNGTITVDVPFGGIAPFNYSATQDFANFVFATNGVIEGLAVGTYTVVVADNNGCTKTVLATIPDATPDNFITTTDSTSCYGSEYNDGTAHIESTTLQNGPYSYAIDSGISDVANDYFYNLSAGAHVITAINNNGCVSTIPIFVFEPLPIVVDVIPDTVVLPLGESARVQVVYLNASGVSYDWSPSLGLSCMDCPNPVVTSYTRGDYVVTVSTNNGACFGTATLHVEVEPHKPVFIPNSFSPNGDGNNDVFRIYGEDIKTVDLKIFNRWGELVYETNNLLAGWDGTYKGQLQNPAVFAFTAKVTFLDDKTTEKVGSLMLLR